MRVDQLRQQVGLRLYILGGKPVKAKVVVASAMLFLSCCSAVRAQWPAQTYGTRPGWEMEMGTRVLDRPGTMLNIPLVSDAVTRETLFNAEQATDLQVSAGVDLRFQKTTDYDMSWEVRGYFNQWDQSESRIGVLDAMSFTPVGLPQNTQLTQFAYDYESEMFNVELNFKRAVRPGLTLMAGPRFMSLDETAAVNANFFNPLVGDFLQIRTLAETRNPLKGLGIGAEFRQPLCRDMFFIGSVRGAVFHNAASSRVTAAQTLFGAPGTTTTFIDDTETKAAGIGELSARIHYDVIPGSVSLFGGYEAMWLDGVAVAPAQILSVSTPALPFVNTQNTIFAHGLSVGGMVRY